MSHQLTNATNVAAAGAVMDSDISAADGILNKTGAGAYEALPSKWAESGDPQAATDDITLGFVPGSRWLNTTSDAEFVCLDNTDGVAVWKETTAAGSGISNVVEDTTPEWGGNMDPNGNAFWDGTNELLEFVEVGSALNHFSISQATTGNGPVLGIGATGTEANVPISITSKGTGTINLTNPVVLSSTLQLGGEVDVNGQFFGDGGGLQLLSFVEDGSAVNELQIENEATGSSPILRGTGGDTDVGIVLAVKGAGVIDIVGGLKKPIRTETGATYAILLSDYSVLSDATAQAQTISLPAIPAAGTEFRVKKIDADVETTTVDTADAATIDGAASVTLLEDDAFVFQSDGTNWYVF